MTIRTFPEVVALCRRSKVDLVEACMSLDDYKDIGERIRNVVGWHLLAIKHVYGATMTVVLGRRFDMIPEYSEGNVLLNPRTAYMGQRPGR